MSAVKRHHVVIIGGGFAGLNTALNLKNSSAEVTLIDKQNYHLFQPLLYQVATCGLSPADIATPLRHILRKQENTSVILGEVIDIDAKKNLLHLKEGEISYDTLVVSCGSVNHYFGNDHWKKQAPGLKTIADALNIRGKILRAFETAERETDPSKIKAHLTFAIVGGGTTGIELAGAIKEIATDTLKNEFRKIQSASARIIIIEGAPNILQAYPEVLSNKVRKTLGSMEIEVTTGSYVTSLNSSEIIISVNNAVHTLSTNNIIWAAGVRAHPIAEKLAQSTGHSLDKGGRLIVEKDLSLLGHPNIFVIGDMASYTGADGQPLPGIAPVAMQQGKYVGRLIRDKLRGKKTRVFKYRDFGIMATIGRSQAVVNMGRLQFTGFFAWVFWLFVHLMYLVEFESRVLVLVHWAWNYFTRNRSARLITDEPE